MARGETASMGRVPLNTLPQSFYHVILRVTATLHGVSRLVLMPWHSLHSGCVEDGVSDSPDKGMN